MHPDGDKATTGQPTRRLLTVNEAAEELGLTVEAVRSRIKRGTLDKEKTADGSVFVVVEDSRSPGQTDQARPGEDHERPGNALGDDWANAQALIIARLEDEVSFLRRQLEHRDHLLAAALDLAKSPALEEATSQPRESSVFASEEQDNEDVPQDGQGQEKRSSSWWRRFFGFE
jgi:hypothetical protein